MKNEIIIETYSPEYENEFVLLNESWINTYFRLENSDITLLSNPQKSILDKGGEIFFALHKKNVVGCCALLKHDDHTYELGKMAVAPHTQGKGVGYQLGKVLIDKAITLGASRIFLEGNTKLEASIRLYRKLGFREINFQYAAYDRCNIKMELELQ